MEKLKGTTTWLDCSGAVHAAGVEWRPLPPEERLLDPQKFSVICGKHLQKNPITSFPEKPSEKSLHLLFPFLPTA